MKKIVLMLLAVAMLTSCSQKKSETQVSAKETVPAKQIMARQGTAPITQGAAANFTGTVSVENIYQPSTPSRTYAAYVTFAPGARTNWHSHPLGQTLIVTQGVAWTEDEFGNTHEGRIGDVIYCPTNITHRYGASPDTTMTHVAVAERLEGVGTKWGKPVTDEQYEKAGITIKGQ